MNTLEKQLKGLDQMETWTSTIQTNGGKIAGRIVEIREAAAEQVEQLRACLDALRPESEGDMRFEVSEQIRTRADIATIIYALFEQLAKVSAKVRLTVEGYLTAKRIEPSFASIVRFDQTNFIVEPKEGGFLFVAEVSYRPSAAFWAILIMCIPSFVAWLVPIYFYDGQKEDCTSGHRRRVSSESRTSSKGSRPQAGWEYDRR